ncbi:MAG: DUF2203 domain-containing protein [Melioribacteraceae bacterium]
MPQIEIKYFTPREANKTLPLVSQIVRDILNNVEKIKSAAERLEGDIEDNPEVAQLASEIDLFMNELNEIGCSYKDWNFSIGLVDFPSVIDGEEVLLCWRSDEKSVAFYHSPDDGFAGRKPIPPDYL